MGTLPNRVQRVVNFVDARLRGVGVSLQGPVPPRMSTPTASWALTWNKCILSGMKGRIGRFISFPTRYALHSRIFFHRYHQYFGRTSVQSLLRYRRRLPCAGINLSLTLEQLARMSLEVASVSMFWLSVNATEN